ncbi:MAG: hypothetical protein ACTSVU_05480 [Promethearchaeota archaeon]
MMIYGNSYTKLSGIIRDIQQQRAIIEFPKYNKQLMIPKLFIHSKITEELDCEQDMEIESWYLKKNHIIPLLDKFD